MTNIMMEIPMTNKMVASPRTDIMMETPMTNMIVASPTTNIMMGMPPIPILEGVLFSGVSLSLDTDVGIPASSSPMASINSDLAIFVPLFVERQVKVDENVGTLSLSERQVKADEVLTLV